MESRAGAWARRRYADPHLGVRLRAVRDAVGPRRRSRARPSAETLAAVLHDEPPVEGAAIGHARRRADGPDALSREGPEAARARHRRRPAGAGRRVHVGRHGPATAAPAVAVARPLWRRAVPVLAALVIGAVVTAIAMRVQEPRPAPPGHAAVARGHGYRRTERERHRTRSDHYCRWVACDLRWRRAAGRSSCVRSTSLEPQSLVTGAVLRSPFVSPDGRWVGFVEDLAPAQEGADRRRAGDLRGTRSTRSCRGAAWLPDNTIVFATNRHRRAAACVGRRRHADDADEAGRCAQ